MGTGNAEGCSGWSATADGRRGRRDRRGRASLGSLVALGLVVIAATCAPPASASGVVIVDTFAGNGDFGFGGDGGPATAAALSGPGESVVDGSGNTYINDTYNSRIRKVDSLGIISTYAELPGTANGLAIDDHANLYVSVDQEIDKVDTSGTVTRIAGGNGYGSGGDGGPATDAQFASPEGLDLDAAGNVYIADNQNRAIRKVDTSGTISMFYKFPDFSQRPRDVAVDSAGNVLVVSEGAYQIYKLDPAGTTLTTIAGTGDRDVSCADGPALAAGFNLPWSLDVDAAANIYVADLRNHCIRKIDTAGNITRVAGMAGPGGYGGDGGLPLNAQFGEVKGVNLDGNGGFYVADWQNARVRHVHSVPDLLQVTMSGAPHLVNVGDVLTYTLDLVNNGTGTATGATAKQTLPLSLTLNSATASQGGCSRAGTTLTCNLGSMAPDAKATITVKVTPTVPGTISSDVTVSADQTDPYTNDNTGSVETLVGAKGCGRTITKTTKLTADLGPCPGNGIVIGADNIKLDLNGHKVYGFAGPFDGTAAGIGLTGRTGVVVSGGEVSDFDAGVMITRGPGGNKVTGVYAHDNIGPDSSFVLLGDGIVVLDSPNNKIIANKVIHNGNFDGIGAFGPTSGGTVIQDNIVRDTVATSNGANAEGIIINGTSDVGTGELAAGGTVQGNTSQNNAGAGISNVNVLNGMIIGNLVENNGFVVGGNGIGVTVGRSPSTFDTKELVKGNTVRNNYLDGIQIGTGSNTIVNNVATGNAQDFPGWRFDLHDRDTRRGTDHCDTNVWRNNTWGNGFYDPACTAVNGSGPAPPAAAAVLAPALASAATDADTAPLSPPRHGPKNSK